jgi:hypothetical protein
MHIANSTAEGISGNVPVNTLAALKTSWVLGYNAQKRSQTGNCILPYPIGLDYPTL